MKQRLAMEHQIVQLQQRLLRERQSAAGHALQEKALQEVRRRNHAALREQCAVVLADGQVRAAEAFFFERLYPVVWPLWRDEQCLRTFPGMMRVMPLSACEVLLRAVELDMLTHEIDIRLSQDAGVDAAWLGARRCEQRERVLELGHSLAAVTRLPLMTLLLKWAGPVARRKGLAELHAFFTAGLTAFLAMRDPHAVLDAIAALDV